MTEIKSLESANNEKNNINNSRNFNKKIKISKFIILHNNKNLWAFFI